MAAPSLLDHGDAARTNDLILGPFAATFAIIAIWDVSRSLGKANLLVGLWLALWVVGYDGWQSTFNSSSTGILICLFTFSAGSPHGQYGGGWSSLWHS